MENPGKYGEFIYAKGGEDEVFVNLFIPSTLELSEGAKLEQKTGFPFAETTELTFELEKPMTLDLKIRHPFWVEAGALKIEVNGEPVETASVPSSYVSVTRTWKDGDVVTVALPMTVRMEPLPDKSDWVALMAGPILLAEAAGKEDLVGLRADDSRMGHVASGPLVPLDEVPVLLKQTGKELTDSIHADPAGGPLSYRIDAEVVAGRTEDVVLQPFFQLHDERYQMYWEYMTQAELDARKAKMVAEEAARQAREAATLDVVAIGEQQSEVEHDFEAKGSETGIFDGKRWRHGESFQYMLDTRGETDVALELTYWGGDKGRIYDIEVNGIVVGTQEVPANQEAVFYRKRYPAFR